jgi:hypothetical protein
VPGPKTRVRRAEAETNERRTEARCVERSESEGGRREKRKK